jgi:hypothetical protein
VNLLPGDILAVDTRSPIGLLIKFGAWLRHQDFKHDHIVIYTHTLPDGRQIGLEARPGGVGWVDLKDYNEVSWVSNAEQPKTLAQRDFIVTNAKALLRTRYDLMAIADDASLALLNRKAIWWSHDFGDKLPAHVQCASYAVWLTHHAGLAYPDQHGERWPTPADWVDWMKAKEWERWGR